MVAPREAIVVIGPAVQRRWTRIPALSDDAHVVRIDQIGDDPSVQVVFRHALLRQTLHPVDRAVPLRHPVALELRQLVAARVRALVQLVAAAELAPDRVPEQLYELDLVERRVAARAPVE